MADDPNVPKPMAKRGIRTWMLVALIGVSVLGWFLTNLGGSGSAPIADNVTPPSGASAPPGGSAQPTAIPGSLSREAEAALRPPPGVQPPSGAGAPPFPTEAPARTPGTSPVPGTPANPTGAR